MGKIVVIEDEDFIRENIAEILEMEGYDVIQAENGYVGTQRVIQQEPDLVLCDIMMPEIDGYEVLRTIRKSTAVATTPFIFLTAKTSTGDFRQGMGLGADDYIPKPFERDELLKAVHTRIDRIAHIKDDIQEKMRNIKRNISSVYSHEFNTPLNGIIGFTDLLLEYYADSMSDEMIEMIKAIKVSSQRLNRVTDNLILFADLQRYDPTLDEPESYKIGATENYTHSLKNDLMTIARFYKREDDLSMDLTNGNLRIAYNDLAKILSEAVDNAIKYSHRGDPVGVQSNLEGAFMHFSVSDQGEGIKDKQLKEFESFGNINIDKSRTLKYGIGLGFYFIRELTRLNEGNVEVESAYKEGTVVHIYIPYYMDKLVDY